MIKCKDYRQFCELHGTVFDSDDFQGIPQEGLVYVPLDRILEFFKLCNFTNNEYILVSGMSDYGIEYQEEQPVGHDMLKWLSMIGGKIQDLGYEPLHIPARCNIETCKRTDDFSVKMYSWTKSTFDVVPPNIKHWFCTNLNVDLPRTTRIPFGVADWVVDKDFSLLVREDKLYVNCQANTVERFNLIRALRNVPWATVESEISHEDFARRLQEHKYVLCPEGNGLDSYRVIETLNAGAYPVMLRNRWNSCYYENFPVILLDRWEDLSYNKLSSATGEIDKTKLSTKFWIDKIKEYL